MCSAFYGVCCYISLSRRKYAATSSRRLFGSHIQSHDVVQNNKCIFSVDCRYVYVVCVCVCACACVYVHVLVCVRNVSEFVVCSIENVCPCFVGFVLVAKC